MIDSNLRRHSKRLGITIERNRHVDLTNFPVEKARLEVAIPTIFLVSALLIGFAWTLHYRMNLAGPLILLSAIGFCLSAPLDCIVVVIIDIYPGEAGTVNASNNLLRCSLGAGATAAVLPMTNTIGIGWTVTFFLVSSTLRPLPFYGMS